MLRLLSLPIVLLTSLIALGSATHHMVFFAGTAAVVFPCAAIIGWTRQVIARG